MVEHRKVHFPTVLFLDTVYTERYMNLASENWRGYYVSACVMCNNM